MITNLSASLSLSSGGQIPILGFGTWKMKPDGEVQGAVRTALETGYRHLDTAAAYENEDGVGEGIRDSGIPREDIFLTTKVFNDEIRCGRDAVLKAAEDSLRLLGTDYLDLYLLHWPIAGKDLEAWQVLEQLLRDGVVRSIGVCNYMTEQLEAFLREVDIPPSVNQVEYHPLLTQPELLEFNRRHGIVQEAWSPIMQGGADHVPVLCEIGARYGKSASQVVLRWDIQQGVVTIPKSVNPERIRENADIFDFELSPEDMTAISALNAGKRLGADPLDFDF